MGVPPLRALSCMVLKGFEMISERMKKKGRDGRSQAE
jgi:hypothetical protein